MRDPTHPRESLTSYNKRRLARGQKLVCDCGQPAITSDGIGPVCARCREVEKRMRLWNGAQSKWAKE